MEHEGSKPGTRSELSLIDPSSSGNSVRTVVTCFTKKLYSFSKKSGLISMISADFLEKLYIFMLKCDRNITGVVFSETEFR